MKHLALQISTIGGLAPVSYTHLYTLENVREKLSLRNFTEELRGGGLVSGGPPALDQRDRQRFANALDRWLARRAAAQAAALRYSESGGSQTSGR